MITSPHFSPSKPPNSLQNRIAMEPNSSSTTSRFRFRDHDGGIVDGESTDAADTSSDSSFLSSDDGNDVDSELDSMTGKGIKRLCSELLELKEASNVDFQENIISYYSSFIRIFEEVGVMENEVLELKQYVTTQKNLVKDLVDGIYQKILSEETVDLDSEEPLTDEPRKSILDNHTDDVSDLLDVLLSEHRLDEALLIFEMEAETSQSMQLREDPLQDDWVSSKSAISERKVMLINQLKLVAENPRVSAAELQKALVGLCRLGVNHLATPLLLKYYHSRIACGIHDLHYSKTSPQGTHIRDVAKFVFSMISQAARSYVVLYGETSPYASELEHWACEETEVFALCFNKYVKSISEISGGLSTAVEAVHFAVSYCSLLETQRIVLRPCLIRHIRPCMEEVLQVHIDHFQKVICIFTSMDTWVVDRYLASGILSEGSSPMAIEQQSEYFFLTNSGRKFVTLLQAITEDVSSLASIEFGGSILKGLMDLFLEYTIMLERALAKETTSLENSGSRIHLAVSLAQQVSIIANVSTLVHFLSSIIRNVFKEINNLKFEIDSYMLTIQDTCSRLRTHFCNQFIQETMLLEDDQRTYPASCIGEGGVESNMLQDLMPSAPYQVLFLKLRKVEKLADDNVVEEDWLMGLLTELVESIFDWISTNNEIWMITHEDLVEHQDGKLMQFSVDMRFLVEVARSGEFLTNSMINASQDLVSRMKLALVSSGYVIDDAQATNAAIKSLQKLKDADEMTSFSDETYDDLEDAIDHYSTQYTSDSVEDDETAENSVNIDELIVAFSNGGDVSNLEADPQKGFVDLGEDSPGKNRVVEEMEADNGGKEEEVEFKKIHSQITGKWN